MQISLEWLSDFVELPEDLDISQLVYDLTMKTVEVERVTDVGRPLRRVIVARVDETDAAASGLAKVVCTVGERTHELHTKATGVAPGMLVAVTLDDAGGGVVHTAAELGLEAAFPRSSGDGPTVLDLRGVSARVGTALADAIGWNDEVLEIDNKSLTNRPDLWCHHGIARELSAIYECELKSPGVEHPFTLEPVTNLIGTVDASLCDRMSIVEIASSGERHQSPLWMRSRLARIGQRSINFFADLANYVMYSVGQPAHVYDGDRARPPFSVSMSESPLVMSLLDAATHDVPVNTVVIADATAPRTIAGVVGDIDSKVQGGSSHVYVEMATFKPAFIRRSSLDLAIRTDSSTRFEKGLDTQRIDVARDHFLHLLSALDPSAQVVGAQDVHLTPTQPQHVELTLGFLEDRIGRRLDAAAVRAALGRLAFEVAVDGETLSVTTPTWRSTGDVSLPEDLVEEIGRLIGYEEFPASAPQVRLTLPPARPTGWLARRAREYFAWRVHMQEVVTYPWAADHYMGALGFQKTHTLTFEGAPAPDRNALRPALLPNLLEAIQANIRHATELRIFELGTVFGSSPREPLTDQAELLPPESRHVAGVFAGYDLTRLFRTAKGAVEGLRRACGLVSFEMGIGTPSAWSDPVAHLDLFSEGKTVGIIGAVATPVLHRLGMGDVNLVCFEIALSELSVHGSRTNVYEPISAYPEVALDLSVVVDEGIRWADIEAVVGNLEHPLLRSLEFVDQFGGGSIPAGSKSVTLRVVLGAFDRTLDSNEIASIRAELVATLEANLGAELRS